MKTKQMNRLTAFFLSVILVFTGMGGYVKADNVPETTPQGSGIELPMEELDPSTLHVKKLGADKVIPEEKITDPDEVYDENDIVRVSIIMNSPSVVEVGFQIGTDGLTRSAKNYRSGLKRTQESILQRIRNKIDSGVDVKWNLTLAINAVSANVRYGDIEEIKTTYGVKDVILENYYEAQVSGPQTSVSSSEMVGATSAWASGYTGAGSKIAIIDSGIDKDHISFNGDAFDHAISELEQGGAEVDLMTEADIPDASELNGEGVYFSSKIPYGFNYVDGNLNIGHLQDGASNHGSHVAGIAAANKYLKKADGTFVSAVDEVKAVGMAPDAQLLVMKVFGVNGGAYDSDYMAAIEDALLMGADAINLSLGSTSPGFTYSIGYQDVLNNISEDQDITAVLTISAGNNGAYTDAMYTDLFIDDVSMQTGGSPGTYINSLGVASADNVGATGTPFDCAGRNIYFNETESTGATFISVPGEWDFVYIDGVGNAAEYEAVNGAVSLKDKVVITNRGSLSFFEKGNNAIPYEPKALIVANNTSGAFGMNLSGYTGSFPMISITLEDAEYMKSVAESGTVGDYTVYTGKITVRDKPIVEITGSREDAVISDFSGWGIPGTLIMKPEITAPGGGIYSVNGTSLNEDETAIVGGTDQYVSYSGTSMAAPHMAGLAAVLAQYIRENPVSEKNEVLAENYSVRAIVQSLLMSTATPMFDGDGNYYPILQQGAGLADVSAALNASSVIMVGEEDDTLTALLGSAKDGKVKAEFGDDPYRTGEYTYSFTIHNTSDSDLEYELNTDLFTQDAYLGAYPDILGQEDYRVDVFMDRATMVLASSADYVWEVMDTSPSGHDVDLDGDTDDDDAQAILDYLTGEWGDQEIDTEAGDMDGDGALTTYDAHLLLVFITDIPEYPDGLVKAHDSRTVTVTVRIDEEDKEYLDEYYTSGAYVEGFTYVTASGETEDGADLSHEHSIPLLGFYGNWSDPSMFDNTWLTDYDYGTYRLNYQFSDDENGTFYTNYLTVAYDGEEEIFQGNPYAIEEEFPADRLALNGNSKIGRFTYNLIRSAGATGFAVSLVDEPNGNVEQVLDFSADDYNVNGLFFSVDHQAWYNTVPSVYRVNRKVSSFGLEEGDTFRAGYYAFPEYYGLLLSEVYLADPTYAYAGILPYVYDDPLFPTLIESGILGNGAYFGYDFTVDNTAPEILSAVLDEDQQTITIATEDNLNLAFVAVLSLDGEIAYYEDVPGTGANEAVINAAEIMEKAEGYVAVFAADYAGNETAVAVKVNDKAGDIDPDVPTSLTLTPESLDLYKGNTAYLKVEVLPITADGSVTWTSSDESVATVDEDGLVTAVAPGTATIRATADKNTSLSDETTVNVFLLDKEMNAIIWDEEGAIFFSKFNTKSLPEWTALHADSKYPMLFHSAFMLDETRLVAATLDSSKAESVLYFVDRGNFELAEIGKNYSWATDMALGSTDEFWANYIGLVYTQGSFLVGSSFNLEGGSFGAPYALADLSKYTEEASLVGVAKVWDYIDPDEGWYGSEYLLIDENGVVWDTVLTFDIDDEGYVVGFTFLEPEMIMETDINASFLYQSVYADDDYLYWSHYDENENVSELLIIDYMNEIVYHAGNFGEAVWPAAGLYVDGAVAPASVKTADLPAGYKGIGELKPLKFGGEEEENLPVPEEEETVSAPAEEEPVTSEEEETETSAVEETEEVIAEDITEETVEEESEAVTEEVPAEETSVEADEPVNVSVGGLNFIRDRQAGQRVRKSVEAEQTVITDAGEEGEVEIEVSLEENKDSTNGLVIIDYDQDVLSYVKSGSELAYHSIHVDEEKGQIIFAYADLEPIAAHEELGEILFEAGCDDAEITVQTVESGDELDLKEEETIPVEGTGHEWEFEGFTWEGTESATADFVCKENAEHKQSIEADIIVLKTEPTTEADGSTTYKAVAVVDGETYTDTKVETIAKITYEITKGANGTWTGNAVTGDPYDLTVVRSYMDETTFSHFKELKMDGKVIDPADYTAKAGSLNISLAPEYLATLSEGQHDLSIVFDDAAVDTKLTIKLEDDSIPDTGVPGTAMPWMIVMTVSFMGIAAVLFFSRKRGFARNE